MKRVLLYGRTDNNFYPLNNEFRIYPDGSIDLSWAGVNKFEIEENEDINWIKLFDSQIYTLASEKEIFQVEYNNCGDALALYDNFAERLFKKLERYCNQRSDAEKNFFNLYCQLSTQDVTGGATKAALIPHVFINWHFSKEERAKKEKPYIVDFVFKHSAFGTNNLVIVEIDGKSHYAEFNNGTYTISEDIYAEHLKKDRWLRKEGFKVFRIGNSEINNIMKLPEKDRLYQFQDFFNEVFGIYMYIE